MGPNGRRRLRRFAIAAPLATGVTALVSVTLGSIPAAVVGALSFLAVAAASDDKVGSCLPLAVLFLLIVILLMMALYAAVMVNR